MPSFRDKSCRFSAIEKPAPSPFRIPHQLAPGHCIRNPLGCIYAPCGGAAAAVGWPQWCRCEVLQKQNKTKRACNEEETSRQRRRPFTLLVLSRSLSLALPCVYAAVLLGDDALSGAATSHRFEMKINSCSRAHTHTNTHTLILSRFTLVPVVCSFLGYIIYTHTHTHTQTSSSPRTFPKYFFQPVISTQHSFSFQKNTKRGVRKTTPH